MDALAVDGRITHTWTGTYNQRVQLYGELFEGGRHDASAHLWTDAPAWFRPFLAICQDNDANNSTDFCSVPAALAGSYTCTVFVTHKIHTVRLYSGHPEYVLRNKEWIAFSQRCAPPLFSRPDPEAYESDEEQEEGFSVISLAENVMMQVHLCHYGTAPSHGSRRGAMVRLSFSNDTGDLEGKHPLLEYLLCLTARASA